MEMTHKQIISNSGFLNALNHNADKRNRDFKLTCDFYRYTAGVSTRIWCVSSCSPAAFALLPPCSHSLTVESDPACRLFAPLSLFLSSFHCSSDCWETQEDTMPATKSKKDAASVGGDSKTSTGTKTKGKKLKRIRGFLTGESRRERRAKKEAARQAAIAAGKTPVATEPDDEDETIYGVDVDNTSLLGDKAKKALPALGSEGGALETMRSVSHALQVILLLMDPKTRRFELLQLEFDSNKAVVRDVLSQVPHSVTEEALRQQNYTGVCDRTGQELYNSTRLADVCSGSDILIALPSSVDARECARLAKPILQDRNVIEMVRVICSFCTLAFVFPSSSSI